MEEWPLRAVGAGRVEGYTETAIPMIGVMVGGGDEELAESLFLSQRCLIQARRFKDHQGGSYCMGIIIHCPLS